MDPTTAPAPMEYGGDEINAIILDPGYSSVRAGYAGEDAPKSFVPAFYAEYPYHHRHNNNNNNNGDDEYETTRHLFGDDITIPPRPRMAIKNPMGRDGVVENWDMAEQVWENAFARRLLGARQSDPRRNGLNDDLGGGDGEDVGMDVDEEEQEKLLVENPLLMTECGWNPAGAREKTIEIAMEKWGTPAFYLARTAPMAAFASGKSSALVVDIGASIVSVTPVHDGLILKRGQRHSNLAGNFISSQIRSILKKHTPEPITITPHYLVSARAFPAPASGNNNHSHQDGHTGYHRTNAVYKDIPPDQLPHPSYRRYLEDRVLTHFKESVVRVWPGPGEIPAAPAAAAAAQGEDNTTAAPPRAFEFPDGRVHEFGPESFYRAVEPVFNSSAYIADADADADAAEDGTGSSSAATTAEFPAPTPEQTIPALIRGALDNVDVDVRPHLLANVVVTGATSLVPGFNDRLNHELTNMYPGARVRITAAGNTAERRFGAWIGGSIVASLGTFHQLWISKMEYDEHGPNIVEKRCK